MAANLLAAGYDVTVWNRTSAAAKRLVEAGATTEESPHAAARGADFVMSMVADDDASSAVWTDPDTGAIAGLSPHAMVIEMSTVSPDWIASLSKSVTASGAATSGIGHRVRPISGKPPWKRSWNLRHICGPATYPASPRPRCRTRRSARAERRSGHRRTTARARCPAR